MAATPRKPGTSQLTSRCRNRYWLPAAAVIWALAPLGADAQNTITVTGNLTVGPGTSPQTWHGAVAVLSGTPQQWVRVDGSLTIAAPDSSRPSRLACTDWTCTASECTTTPIGCVQAITTGESDTCAIVDGGARCWGWNYWGQLGDGSTIDRSVPVQVFGLTSDVETIDPGAYHTCATVRGRLDCWGSGAYLGNGSTSSTPSYIPVPVSGLSSGASSLAVGFQHTCAVVNGGAYCWGNNRYGQLGDGTKNDSLVPVQVLGLGIGSGVQAIAVGNGHSCAIVNGGAVCWGAYGSSVNGDIYNLGSTTPVQVSALTSGVQAITAGAWHTCVIVNGGAMCWGANNYGELGGGFIGYTPGLVQVSGLTSGVFAIDAGNSTHTCAIVNGSAQCWGTNYYGALGNGSATTYSSVPVQVTGLTLGVQAISAGGNHSCALVNGRAWCWGQNTYGELGDGTTNSSSLPIDVSGNLICGSPPPPSPCVKWVCNVASRLWESTAAAPGTLCRPSAGVCDVAEYCDGVTTTCPPDLLASVYTECRLASGNCDVSEFCTGYSALCPDDKFKGPGNMCRPAVGVCDVPEYCTGSGPACGPDLFEGPTKLCRASAGVCDAPEYCTGSGPMCGPDLFEGPTKLCRASAGVCDIPEYCTGSGPACGLDLFEGPTKVCRAAADTCDIAETCPGSSPLCPADLVAAVCAAEGAEYDYDTAGNILQIRPAVAPAASVVDFAPRQGGAGDLVTVSGAGFSPQPSLNTVLLGGVSAAVLSATSSRLTFVVPAGATTGKISVTSGGNTGRSVNDFVVVTGVVVSGFAPRIGTVGAVLTINGFNFNPNATVDSVLIGTGSSPATSASTNSLLATVGIAATSGKVTVTTPAGSGTSADDFFLLPAIYSKWDIGFTGRALPGSPTTATISQLGQAALVLFDGVQGDFMNLYVSGVTFTGMTQITVYAPNGTSVFTTSGIIASRDYKLELPALPASGTYTVAIEPAMGGIGSLDLRVLKDASAVLQAGAATPLTLVPGQNGRYTFPANAGDWLSLACAALATTQANASVAISIYRPDGVYMWGGNVLASMSWSLPRMPLTGTYTMVVRPSGTSGASMTFLLSQAIAGTLIVDGNAVQFQNSIAGQSTAYTFAGSAGDRLGLGVSALTSAPAGASLVFAVYKPDGTFMAGPSTSTPNSFQLPQLPVSGTYTVLAQPSGVATLTATILLSRPLVGTLAADGTSTTYATTRVGQSGRYAFTASAGQRFTMQTTAGTLSGYAISVLVYQPSGASIGSSYLYSNNDLKIDLGVLPASGTYTVTVEPQVVATGQVALRLVSYATDALAVGDPAKAFSLGTAQNGWYTFTGNVGDLLGLGVTALSGSTLFYLYAPDGSTVWSSGANYPTSFQVPQLPTTGTYALKVWPSATAPASLTMLLSQTLTGTLATDGTPITYQTTRAGQSGRYTFTGTAGQRFTLQATAGPLSGSSVSVSVYQPSGSYIAGTSLSSNGDYKIDLAPLPSSGTYTVTITPQDVTAGQVVLRLVPYATDTLALADPAKTLTLGTAQNGWYTFAGSAGDLRNLVVTGLTTTPGNAYVYFYVYKPDGSLLSSSSLYPPGSTLQLPQFPVAGTYALAVKPGGVAAASFATQLMAR